jgi:hypothetical protein
MLHDPKTITCAMYVYTGVLHMRVEFDLLGVQIHQEYSRSATQGWSSDT